MNLKLVATVVCEYKADGRVCTETEEYEEDFRSNRDWFVEEAKKEFIRLGWKLTPKCLCPMHVQ